MQKLRDKLILTDIDGVVLDWNFGFEIWMLHEGYISSMPEDYDQGNSHSIDSIDKLRYTTKFCTDPALICNLSPYKNSIKYIRKLHEDHGYVFHAITAINSDLCAARQKNLDWLFGKGVFIKVDCVGAFGTKTHILDDYKNSGCWWLEDDVNHARDGLDRGLNSILVNHSYNKTKNQAKIKNFANNWEDIYEHIINNNIY